jgi:hypothetical protein
VSYHIEKEECMVTGDQKTVHPHGAEKEGKPAESQAGAGKEDACRCKEVSVMTPRELLRLTISDLAFWKKAKKG